MKSRDLMQRVKDHVVSQAKQVTLEGALWLVARQLVKHGGRLALPAVAIFGAGVTVGAGAALLLAPTSGAAMRAKITRLLEKLARRGGGDPAQDRDASAEPAEAPHQDAARPEA